MEKCISHQCLPSIKDVKTSYLFTWHYIASFRFAERPSTRLLVSAFKMIALVIAWYDEYFNGYFALDISFL